MFSSLLVLSVISIVAGDECSIYCSSVEECRTDPRGRGSFCKTDKTPQVCFGLYWKDSGKTEMCYQPNSQSCPGDHPVGCGYTTSAPEVTLPSGRYEGSAMMGAVALTADFNPQAMTVDISVRVGGTASFRGPGIQFTMSEDGSRVVLSDTPQRAAFLESLPIPITPERLVIRYNFSSNRVIGQLDHIVVETRRV